MRRAALAVALLVAYSGGTMLATKLRPVGGGGASFTPPQTQQLVGLMNAASDATYAYTIGPVTSSDGGVTITPGAGAEITAGTGGSWDDVHVKDPALVHDGTQFVAYYAGFDGANYRIGRATAATIDGTWTKDGSNPVIGFGASGAPDEAGAIFPVVTYSAAESPAWKMWYGAMPAGATAGNPSGVTIAFADSADGITWTKRGRVLNVGTSGTFDDVGLIPGTVIRIGSTWHLFYTGFRSNLLMHTGYATTTDPDDTGAYTRVGSMAGYTGNLSLGGWTWQSNMPRTILSLEGGYRIAGTVWNPTPSDTEEATWSVLSSSLTSWPAPTDLAFSLSGWYANSGENPTMIVAP